MPRATDASKKRRWALIGAIAFILLVLALAATWRFTHLHEIATPAAISRWLKHASREGWMPLVVAAVYIVASLVMFPNTVLCFAVILALGPFVGTAYAFGGSLCAALAGYALGRWGGRFIEKLRVGAVNKMSAKLRKGGGFVQVLAMRVFPVAPFSATNIVSGAARVNIVAFLAATAVGIAPYILTFALFGRQARRLFTAPTLGNGAIALAIVVVAALGFWGMRAVAARVGKG